MMHTLWLLYLGGVIAEILEQAGHWRTFQSISRAIAIREDTPETMPELGLGIGVFIGIAASSVVNGFKWPYRLTRKLWKSRIGHTSLGDEVIELSMRMSFLQAISDYRLDARMSIHVAKSQLGDTYSAVMESMEKILVVTVPGLKPPMGYAPPDFGEPVFRVRPPTQEELNAATSAANGFVPFRAVQMPMGASEIAAAVAAMVPPPEPEEETLRAALKSLQREFPGTLHEVRAERALGERSPAAPEVTYGSEQSWDKLTWTVQVGNERAHDESLEDAIVELRKKLDVQALLPNRAQRLADVLREIPERGFERGEVIDAAQRLLEDERQAARMKGDS